ncbi:hypothetical protein M9H77_01123 [Catharanthus roseus]|uniref:Uncharacterized protein n=1 Tax=Catharanthus roseus TaxID=4058 RepID=A0ACC0C4Q7_CATRO|nr:hypothetical protein M9H77_01123 [Catharanthus roseus]
MGVAAAPLAMEDSSTSTFWHASACQGKQTSAADIAKKTVLGKNQSSKKPCICSPTSHPGSFRCRLHRRDAPAVTHTRKTKTTTQTTIGLSRFARDAADAAAAIANQTTIFSVDKN